MDFGLWSCGFRGNVIVYRAHNAIQVEDCRPRRRSWSRFPLTRSCPELFRGTGPLLSLVLRTEDVWQRYNQYVEVCGTLNQGFPFSPLQCRQGRTRMDEGEAMCTMHAVVVLCFWCRHLTKFFARWPQRGRSTF